MLAESYYVSFGSAVKESPTDLYEGYSEIKELLLKRSLVSYNRPLYFAIVDSIVFYKINGSFLSPCDYILIKSCDTHKRSEIFIERIHHYLLSLDLSNKDDIVAFLKEIGIQGIHILSGMRHTTGSMFLKLSTNTQHMMIFFLLAQMFLLKHLGNHLIILV